MRALKLLTLCSSLATIALLTGCNASSSVIESTSSFPKGTGFMHRDVTVDGTARRYAIFVPKNYNPANKYPAIVFLHGVLEAGSDATKNLGVGIGPIIRDRADTWPFITLFPQSGGDWQGQERANLAIACLDDASRAYSIDPSRVILTGLSNGGQGTWLIGAAYKNRFAALVPMAGHAAYDVCPQLTGIPIWCFHNGGDFIVPSGGASGMCERIKAAGGNVLHTQYGDIGHNCWDTAYSDDQLINWMLAQRKGGGGVASPGVSAGIR
jgi:predicted peptidase